MNIIQKSEAIKAGLRKSFQDGSSKIAHRKRYGYEVGPDIEPEKIICYNTPFPEMQGDIVFVDYERSSWKFMNYERSFRQNDLEAFEIGGQPGTLYDTIAPFLDVPVTKGGDSAYGGKWKPAKPEDERLIGEPGEIKVTFNADGTKIETKIGPDGFAERERHHTSAPNPKYHTNPHDHMINWHTSRERRPNFGKPIDYWDGNPPEFKMLQRGSVMKSIIYGTSTPEDNCFKTISEFKECIICGGEVVFTWAQQQYGVFKDDLRYCIALANGEKEKWCDTPDEVLEYIVGGDRLRDVITQVTVTERTI